MASSCSVDGSKARAFWQLTSALCVLLFALCQAKLRCPCCNMRDKETVLTKCFHVFCYECLKMRYDTRQRKCPKCNCAFGANDFHRIYIT